MRRIVVAGASRGLGAVIAHHYVAAGDDVIALSRTPSVSGDWIACDLADSEAITRVAGTIAGAVDVLIFVAGIWEAEAFSDDYSFAGSSSEEISRVIAVNLQAPILLSKALLPQLLEAGSARIVLIGSTSGLDNIGTPEVAYNASKAGLRGAAQALAQALAVQGLSVSVLNPGDIGTNNVLDAKARGGMRPGGNLPMSDLLVAVDFLLALSPQATLCEVNLIPLGS